MALGAKDDWNLTDWFENIYIRQAGVAAYDKLFSAEGDWADPSVQKDVDTMLEVINDKYVVGGIDAAVGRAWTDAIAQVFKPEPEAGVFYEGGFVGGIATTQTNTDLVIGETIDWFPFPTLGNTDDVTTFGGDVVGALTDSEGAKQFMQYVVTPEANAVWAGTGAIVSPHTGVETSAYPNDLVVREAEITPEGDRDPVRRCRSPARRDRRRGPRRVAATCHRARHHHRLGGFPDARQGRLGRRVIVRSV